MVEIRGYQKELPQFLPCIVIQFRLNVKKERTFEAILKHFPQLLFFGASLVAQLVKNLPAIWKTWVRSLGWEDPLEKEKAMHPSILAWRTPWTV